MNNQYISNGEPLTVAVCSIFRNSSEYIDYYRAIISNQIGDGRRFKLIFSFVEGDSTDDTWKKLDDWRRTDERVTITKKNVEPIADFSDRVRKWADVGNAALAGLAGKKFDYLLWTESDLCLPADLALMLLQSGKDIVAPVIFLGGQFYDTWGFRGVDGKKFDGSAPFHSTYQPFSLFRVNSVGSVVMFKNAVLEKGLRFRGTYEDGLLVGMCNDARSHGFEVYCDSRVSVVHPTSLWRNGQYTFGSIEVIAPEASDGLTVSIKNEIERMVGELALGIPTIPASSPLCQTIASRLQLFFAGWVFTASMKLHSEFPKRFLVVCEAAKASDSGSD